MVQSPLVLFKIRSPHCFRLSTLILCTPGSCQFPTLGFVVDQYWKRERFVTEPFWSISVSYAETGGGSRGDTKVTNFSWTRHHLYDRIGCLIFYERCVECSVATVVSLECKETRKWLVDFPVNLM